MSGFYEVLPEIALREGFRKGNLIFRARKVLLFLVRGTSGR